MAYKAGRIHVLRQPMEQVILAHATVSFSFDKAKTDPARAIANAPLLKSGDLSRYRRKDVSQMMLDEVTSQVVPDLIGAKDTDLAEHLSGSRHFKKLARANMAAAMKAKDFESALGIMSVLSTAYYLQMFINGILDAKAPPLPAMITGSGITFGPYRLQNIQIVTTGNGVWDWLQSQNATTASAASVLPAFMEIVDFLVSEYIQTSIEQAARFLCQSFPGARASKVQCEPLAVSGLQKGLNEVLKRGRVETEAFTQSEDGDGQDGPEFKQDSIQNLVSRGDGLV